MGRKTHPRRGSRPQATRNKQAAPMAPRRMEMIKGGGGHMLGLVKPDAICHGNPLRLKHAFITEGKAAKALFNARANHELTGEWKTEERYYRCDYSTEFLAPYNARVDLTGTVEHFHLTSQPARPDSEERQ